MSGSMFWDSMQRMRNEAAFLTASMNTGKRAGYFGNSGSLSFWKTKPDKKKKTAKKEKKNLKGKDITREIPEETERADRGERRKESLTVQPKDVRPSAQNPQPQAAGANRLKPEQLGQAILWSEILGDPVFRKRRRKRMSQQYGNQGDAYRR